MKKIYIVVILAILLAACRQQPTPKTVVVPTAIPPTMAPTAAVSATPQASVTPVPPTSTVKVNTPTPTLSPTASYPVNGYGPTGFPAQVNPLTGLVVADTNLLNRRPVVVKIENLPREHRPPFGVTLADMVYEYYTEQGGTRFAAVFYGKDAEKVGPIRSARFFDFNVVRMYKASFVFGYAYSDLFAALQSSEFNNRLIIEGVLWKDVFSRYEPDGANLLLVNTGLVADALKTNKVDNSRQNQEGMLFKLQAPGGGTATGNIFVRYSGAIYNRWDYDPQSGKYLRFSDAADDANRNNEKYAQLTDRLTKQPVAVENLVMLEVEHKYVKKEPIEVYDMNLIGEGKAYIARDGQIYEVKWKRTRATDVISLVNKDGTPFAFKPGQTWFEVLGINSKVEQLKDGAWKFTHMMP